MISSFLRQRGSGGYSPGFSQTGVIHRWWGPYYRHTYRNNYRKGVPFHRPIWGGGYRFTVLGGYRFTVDNFLIPQGYAQACEGGPFHVNDRWAGL